ncbi:MAG: Tic22 family protein [Cyanobacteria bacterium J06642_11]
MNRLNHGLRRLGCLGSAIVGTVVTSITPAFSLTTTQVAEKLGSIPVFVLGFQNGESVSFLEETITTSNGEATEISRVYLNPNDANAYLELIQTENQELSENLVVAGVPLGEVFCLSQQESQPCDTLNVQYQGDLPNFIYLPDRTQLEAAKTLLQQQGVTVAPDRTFVPLFFTNVQVPEGNARTLPFVYFNLDELRQAITEVQADPELSDAQFEIQVVEFNNLLQNLMSDNNPGLEELVFVPLFRVTQ